MTIYELIEKMITDLHNTAAAILNTAGDISTLRDALKQADAARLEAAKKAEEGAKEKTEE